MNIIQLLYQLLPSSIMAQICSTSYKVKVGEMGRHKILDETSDAVDKFLESAEGNSLYIEKSEMRG